MTEHHEPLSDSERGSDVSGRDTRFQAKVSPEMHEQIVHRARAGESNAQIGRDLGISGQRVGQIVRAHGGLRATGPTSLDADARSRSLANLKDAPPAPRGNLRHLKHGLRSERTMQPYRPSIRLGPRTVAVARRHQAPARRRFGREGPADQ